MPDWTNKEVLVLGLGSRGRAACELLHRAGANVTGFDRLDSEVIRGATAQLRSGGVRVELGKTALPDDAFDFAVVSPEVPANAPEIETLSKRGIPLIGELELGFQRARCLSIAIAGTNGKGTTAEIVEQMLINNHRKAVLAGHGARPICSIADQTANLDLLVLQVNSFQLDHTEFFRPAVAVLLNLAPDFLDRYASRDDYARATARLFANQQAFDWAIVQTEALAQLKSLGLEPRSKVITFSARDQSSDICLDRGLIISRLASWQGPLLNTDQCHLRGPHNAENLMAALTVGHALRLPLETMVDTLKNQRQRPHCFEFVLETDGVQFINDSKAMNIDALRNALSAARAGEGGRPNVWLIAGGKDKGLDFHDIGPMISKRVKGAFLIGEAREKIRAAWSLFTACTLSDSLLEAVTEAARNAAVGDVVLLSPACSSFDQFQNYQERGERFCQIVKSISRGSGQRDPNMNDKTATT